MNRGSVFSEYRRADGLFTSQLVQGFRPPDTDQTAWKAGRYDHRSQRVDLATGEAIDDPDLARRFADEQARGHRRTSALAQIAALEQRELRPLRELQLDPTNTAAAKRLAEIEAQISLLREGLK